MTTYLIRHGRTDYSSRYLVNGDPTLPIQLNEEGVQSCHAARPTIPASAVRTWIASTFPRTQQTAALLSGDATPLSVHPFLDELDYGAFEGRPFLEYAGWLQNHGPRARPPGAGESQHEGIRRMLQGLVATLDEPGPRVVVAHGLLLSVMGWHLTHALGAPMPLFFPEAAYLVPLTMTDAQLAARVAIILK